LIDDNGLDFTDLVKLVGNWSNAFLATVFLAHGNEVRLEQKQFYEDLRVYEPRK